MSAGRAAAEAETLLDFWFGEPDDQGRFETGRLQLWFGKEATTDERLHERFGHLHGLAARGDLDRWAESPRGRLALVLLLDQLPRNLHRDTAAAFAHDAKARALAEEAIARKEDAALRPVERAFLYLPLEHAEDPDAQERAVRLYEALAAAVPEALRGPYETFLDYARRHRDVIARFGRFPHRNRILGRTSTDEERAFLTQPGSSF